MSDEPDLLLSGELVRPYVITQGRELPSDRDFSVATLVKATDTALQSRVLAPESRQILQLCSRGFLSVAEIAGQTELPLGIVRVLLSQLREDQLITTRAPIPLAQQADKQLLKDVLNGLKERFGA